jgi:hypothetical protein
MERGWRLDGADTASVFVRWRVDGAEKAEVYVSGCAGFVVKGRVGDCLGTLTLRSNAKLGTTSEPASVTCHRHTRSKPAATRRYANNSTC